MDQIDQVHELSACDTTLPKHVQKAIYDLDGDVVVFINAKGDKWFGSCFYTEEEEDDQGNLIDSNRYNPLDCRLPDLGESASMDYLDNSMSDARWDTIREYVKNHLAFDMSWINSVKSLPAVCTCGGAKARTTHSSWCDIQ